jgi:AraC family transcriptional regulator
MNKDILKAVEIALTYIEVRLTQKIQLDNLADITHISKYHLHRLLSHVVGQPLMNYIRARKLSASIELLMEPQYNILDVCNCFAFEHEQSYIRAFKKQFGLTPTQFRKETPELSLTEKVDLSHLTEIYDGIIFKPLVKFMPDLPLVGLRHTVNKEDNDRDYKGIWVGNDFISNHQRLVSHKVNTQVLIVLSSYSRVGDAISDYIPSVQVSQWADIPEGMELNILPAGKYLVFTYIGTVHSRDLTALHFEQIWKYFANYVRLNKPSTYQSAPFHYKSINKQISIKNYCEVEYYIPVQSLPAQALRNC